MKRTSNSVVQTTTIELTDEELTALVTTRATLREMNEREDSELVSSERWAIEQSIYLISTILGSHE